MYGTYLVPSNAENQFRREKRGVRYRRCDTCLIRLKSGITLVLEVKGAPREVDESKWRYMKDWVAAVNSHGGFGPWSWDVLTPDKTLKTLLDNQSRLSLPAGWLHLELCRFSRFFPVLARSRANPSRSRVLKTFRVASRPRRALTAIVGQILVWVSRIAGGIGSRNMGGIPRLPQHPTAVPIAALWT